MEIEHFNRLCVFFKPTPKIGVIHAVIQMLCCGQICEFCHIESHDKNNVTGLIKLQSTSFCLHMELFI